MKLNFYLHFNTKFGQQLFITGNIDELGNNDPAKALLMGYLNEQFWNITLELKRKEVPKNIAYRYFLKNEDGQILQEWGHDKELDLKHKDFQEIEMIDVWNHAGEYENVFYSAAFNEVLLKGQHSKVKSDSSKNYTHIFKVKAPLLKKNEIVCIGGNDEVLGDWNTEKLLLLGKEENWWTLKIDLSESDFPIAYKYGVYNTKENKLVKFEDGDNRLLYGNAAKKKLTILHDGFIHTANNTWKGAGVAIPVFSLRSENSFGVGEFADIKLLADWASKTGLKLIQILPVNDTIATNSWKDSYPYAAISAFALHPLYINLDKVAGKQHKALLSSLKEKQGELNKLAEVDYEAVIKNKLLVLRKIYEVGVTDTFESEEYEKFYKQNKHWLEPYTAFCYYRDIYGSSVFSRWETNAVYDKTVISKLFSNKSAANDEVNFYCFVQFHLHLQLKDAAAYAHKKGIVLKGDIPIGIYRHGCDAWVAPELYNMKWQAGAPPDDFTAVGQNWGFPTYNWKQMQQDNYAWWKQRFEQMSAYFDAFRIDHILGFFRIWSIPVTEIQGIMGRFVDCLPVHINEFGENGIWFDYQRYCRPFITEEVLWEIFGMRIEEVKEEFLAPNNFGGYDLKLDYETQQQVEEYFATKEQSNENEKLKLGIFDLISNVILFEEEGTQGEQFHFRISMEKTLTYKHLIPYVQEKLKALYVNYFYRRQDAFWYKEAMQKLPQLKAATNMLVCGEDLGMVPDCVPDVMKQLGILSLEIQRMPKDSSKQFFHPNDAPYLSVITPSTHDMSTIRGWWEENNALTQQFYNTIMGQQGDAPANCEAWINTAIVMQHLYSPAMWSIFQLQDMLGMNENLRRKNAQKERINDPANPNNYWRYRMHISLEDLLREKEFNEELKGYVEHSGRG